MDSVCVLQQSIHSCPYVGIQVYRVDDTNVGMQLDQILECQAHIFLVSAQGFPPVRGDENDPAAVVRNALRQWPLQGLHFQQHFYGVHHRIPGDCDLFRVHALSQKVFARQRCWRKIKLRYHSREPAIHLFRVWIEDVAAAQSGFDMGYWNAAIKSRQGGSKGRSRVALDHQAVERR